MMTTTTRRIAVIGDLHLGRHLYGVDLTEEILQTMHAFFRFAVKLRVDSTIALGDVFDSPTPTVRLQKAFVQWCNEFERAKLPLFVLVGNHDVVHTPGIGSAIEPIKIAPFNHVRVIDRPTLLGDHYLLLPFPSPGIYQDATDYGEDVAHRLDQAASRCRFVAFAHANVSGAKLGAQEFVYRGGEHGLDEQVRKRYTHVVNGHIHKSQTVGNVTMPGSAVRMSFDEAADVKEFLLVDGYLLTHFRRECLYLRTLEVDASGWAHGGEAPTTQAIIAYFDTLDVGGALVKLVPFVDSFSRVNWAYAMEALYKNGARHVFLEPAVKAEQRVAPIPKKLLTDPIKLASAFAKRKIKDPSERRAVLKLFRQVRQRVEADEERER